MSCLFYLCVVAGLREIFGVSISWIMFLPYDPITCTMYWDPFKSGRRGSRWEERPVKAQQPKLRVTVDCTEVTWFTHSSHTTFKALIGVTIQGTLWCNLQIIDWLSLWKGVDKGVRNHGVPGASGWDYRRQGLPDSKDIGIYWGQINHSIFQAPKPVQQSVNGEDPAIAGLCIVVAWGGWKRTKFWIPHHSRHSKSDILLLHDDEFPASSTSWISEHTASLLFSPVVQPVCNTRRLLSSPGNNRR